MKHRAMMSLLALATVGSLVGAAGTVLVLNPEDRISIRRGMVLTAFGAVFFVSLFNLINIASFKTSLGIRFRQRYNLSYGDLLDISNKIVSAVQALLCCLTGAVVCLYSCPRDLLKTSHYMSEAYAWFGAAYFFYDIWSMYKVYVMMMCTDREYLKKKTGKPGGQIKSGGDQQLENTLRRHKPSFCSYLKHEPVILMHHVFIGAFGFLVITYFRKGLGDCVFGFAYLMELSTPFVSFRGILSRMKLKESRMYVANGVTMLVTFFFCRVASMPYVCLMYSRTIEKSYVEAIQTLPTGCKISIAILLLPQVYWFYLMARGAAKVFLAPKKPSTLAEEKVEKTS